MDKGSNGLNLEVVKSQIVVSNYKLKGDWQSLFSKMIVVVIFEEEMESYFDVYESLANEFISMGTKDVRCVKSGSLTEDRYNRFPSNDLKKRRFYKKYSWTDNYPSKDSVFCVIRLLSGIHKGFDEMWSTLSRHCKENKIPEYLITPTGQGAVDYNLSDEVKIIYWERPIRSRSVPVLLNLMK